MTQAELFLWVYGGLAVSTAIIAAVVIAASERELKRMEAERTLVRAIETR